MKKLAIGQYWLDFEPGPLARLVVVRRIDPVSISVLDISTGKDEVIDPHRFMDREDYTLAPSGKVTDTPRMWWQERRGWRPQEA